MIPIETSKGQSGGLTTDAFLPLPLPLLYLFG